MPRSNVALKRAYEPASPDDGARILVDRLWPRGVSKEKAALTEWMKQIAPSDELRRWFNHDPARWDEFRERYMRELKGHTELLDHIRKLAKAGPVTLIYGAKDQQHNEATVLRDLLDSGA